MERKTLTADEKITRLELIRISAKKMQSHSQQKNYDHYDYRYAKEVYELMELGFSRESALRLLSKQYGTRFCFYELEDY